MDIQTIKGPVKQFYNNLSSAIHVDKIIIFGSRSTGLEKKHSDIDIIVVSDDFKSIRSDIRLKILDTASKKIYPEIQAWGLTSEEFESAGELTTIGNARSNGYRFI